MGFLSVRSLHSGCLFQNTCSYEQVPSTVCCPDMPSLPHHVYLYCAPLQLAQAETLSAQRFAFPLSPGLVTSPGGALRRRGWKAGCAAQTSQPSRRGRSLARRPSAAAAPAGAQPQPKVHWLRLSPVWPNESAPLQGRTPRAQKDRRPLAHRHKEERTRPQ